MNQVSVNTNAFDAILQAGPIVQLTLLILVGLSILCWAIGWTKWRQLKNIQEANEVFSARFWKSNSLDSLYEEVDTFRDSSLARVFKAVYVEMKKLAESPHLNKSGDDSDKPQLAGIDNLERVLRKSTEIEIAAMEKRLPILATTGSTGPFIGLFGTVWGIMSSFHKIGQTGSASLAVVAPGISEALVATAIGLAAAIPAVVLYNNFVSRIRHEEIDLNNFSADFLNIVKRNFFKQ
ncbi:MAG: protein TolQ [Bdellovibrionaceae bacterium]|nr:protein TolQ [Pseudobdellovibrionaceae bacterium]MBX3034095.1 protein TolQ [Pseudobdellovibrionaceae bacterium]